MTNDNTRKKANAVFFAAVMVISMVAAGFAAAPVAAVESGDTIDIGEQLPTDDGNVSVSITNNSGPTGIDGSALITYEDSDGDTILAGAQNVTAAGNVQVSVEDTDGLPGDHTAHLSNASVDNLTSEIGGEVTTNDLGTIVDQDTAYVGTRGDAALNTGSTFWQGQELGFNVTDSGVDAVQIRTIDTSSDPDSVGGLVDEFSLEGNSSSFGVVDTGTLDADEYVVVNASNTSDVLAFSSGTSSDGDVSDTFEVATQSLSTEFVDDSVESGETTDLDIDSNRASYDVVVSADGDLDDQELETIFNTSDFGDVSDVDDDDEVTVTVESDGELSTNFSDIDEGEYEFTFEVDDSTAEDTASINVTEAGEGELDLDPGSVSTPQGDVVNVTVDLSDTETGTVVIGDREDDGYQANVSVVDDDEDGQVSLLFNTYTAGRQTADVVSLADSSEDDEFTLRGQSTTGLGELLDTGDYDISVSAETISSDNASVALGNESDVGTLTISERSTGEMVLWRTTDEVRDDVVEVQDDDGDEAAVEAIVDGAESGVVTQTDQVALGAEDNSDVLVHQITVSGLQGALDAQNADSNAEALYGVLSAGSTANEDTDANAVSLIFEEQNPGANQEANEINVSEDIDDADEFATAADVVYDEANDDYYVFLDLDTLNSALSDNGNTDGVEDGDEYTADFSVQDPLLTDAEADDDEDDVEAAYQSANADFDVVEADGDFDGDPIQVANAENQSITGTMNVAPGTEFSVRARSDEDSSTSFVKNAEDVTVQPDGTFSAQVDFNEQEVNDTFTTTTRNSPLDEELEVDGEVVEAVGSPAVFEVSELNPSEATVTAGDTIDASATIENTGEQQDTKTVEFTVDGDAVASEDVTIAGGESTTFEVSVDTTGLEPGDYEHAVVTPDDEATGSLTIEAADDGGDGDDGGSGDDGGDGDDGGSGDDGGDGSDGGDDGGDGGDSTDDSTPGFGALVALVALIAAALLATRRNE